MGATLPIRAGGQGYDNTTGTIAGLAAGGATAEVVFDLGQDWYFYTLVQVCLFMAGASATNKFEIFSRSPGKPAVRLGNALSSSNGSSSRTNVLAAAGWTVDWVRPMGRYLVLVATNSDGTNALAATARVDFAAYPGV